MKSTIKLFCLAAAMFFPLLAQSQNTAFFCTFEDDLDTTEWVFVNSSTANKWYIDTAVASAGLRSMYISSDNGATNTYSTGSTSVSYAYHTLALDPGMYNVRYDWQCYGEGNYDYLRVFVVPNNTTFTPDMLPGGSSSYNFTTTVPAGWICLNGSQPLNQNSTWRSDSADFVVTHSDTMKLVFVWACDGSGGSNPAGAIDNVGVTLSDCPYPANPTINGLLPTSFTLSWTEVGSALMWHLELDSTGVPFGSGIELYTYDTFYTFTGLTPSTQYTIHLASNCSGDTSRWNSITITTPCDAIDSLPYFEDFENSPTGSTSSTAFVNCWYHLNNTTSIFGYPYVSSSSSHNGGTKGLYWYSYGSTGPFKGATLPLVDSTLYPIDTLQLSFWARATSASYRPEFIIGVVPNIADFSSFIPVDTIYITGTEWTFVNVPLNSYQGPHGLIAIMAPVSASTWYAYTDEFTLEVIPECTNILRVDIDRVGSGSAILSCSLNGVSINPVNYYEIEYDTVGATGFNHTMTAPTSSFIISGLEPSTDYQVRVRAVCSNNSTGSWATCFFTTRTMPCAVPDPTGMDTLEITQYASGSTSTTTYYIPLNNYYNYSYTQQIVFAEEMNGPASITGIDFQYNFSTAMTAKTNCTIYLSNTTISSLSGGYVPFNNAEFVAVYTGSLNCHSGWNHFNFDTPFAYDGTNLLITILDNSGRYNSTSYTFNAHSATSGIARHLYNDGSPYTPSSLSTTSGNVLSYRNNMKIYTLACAQTSPCAPPLVQLTRLNLDTVTIEWGAGYQETSWNIHYLADDDTAWTVINNVTDREYSFIDLVPMTHYTVHVFPDCGGDSVFTSVDFTTPCVPITTLPFTEDFENFTASSSVGSPTTMCWHRTSNYTSTSYPYLSTSYAHNSLYSLYFYSYSSTYSTIVLPEMRISVDSLFISFAAYKTAANYNIVAGVMSDPEDFSTFVPIDTLSPATINNWEMFEVHLNNYSGNGKYIALASFGSTSTYMYIDDITVDLIPSCPRPYHVTPYNIATTTAFVSWDSCGSEYIIEYGPYGFNHGEGMLTYSYDDSVTLYGLVHSTRYQVYVRAICGAGDTSDWSFVSGFTTVCGEIDTLPFIEKFLAWGTGSSSARPDCWSMGGYSSYPYIVNLTTPDSVYRALNMYTYGANQTYATLPALDSIQHPINTTQVVITAVSNNYSNYSHILVVGTSTQPGNISTFTPVDTIQLSDIVNTYEVAFDSVTSGAKYITLLSCTDNGFNYNYAYVIDVRVEAIPPCQVPNRIRTSNLTSNSADIHWNDRSSSSTWQIEYGTRGFFLGSGTRVTVTANPYPLTGLTPSTTYDVYVRSICAVGDTSSWNRAPMRFSTLQQPAAVPYFCDFETPNEWNNWQTCSNVASNWFRDTAAGSGSLDGSGRYAIYISSDSGATVSTDLNAVVNAVAYRDFDFGTDPYHTYQVSFRAKSGGNPSAGYDGLMMLHVDPNRPVVASSVNINSPWGHPDTLERYFFVRCNGYWNTYTTTFDTLTGIHRFALYWFNQSVSGFVGVPAAVDDFRITSIECPRPAGVRAENVTISSADLSWVAPEINEYRVTVRNQSGVTFYLDTTVYTNHIHLSDLSPANTYLVYVRRVCDSNDISTNSVAYSFMTLICNGGNEFSLASANPVTSSFLPIHTGSPYSYSQQLVMANELSGSGEISAISFRYTGSVSITEHTNCTISMGHTSMSSFGNNFVNPDSLTVVYTGAIRSEGGWTRLIFQTPFIYNGSDNLVIAIDDNSNRYSTSYYNSQYFAVDQLSSSMSVCYYGTSDIIPTYNNLANFTGNRYTYNSRNQMIIEVCPPNTCTPPVLRTPVIRTGRVTLRWSNTSDRYDISYRPVSTTSWIVDQLTVTDNHYDITRVTPNTDYVYRVRQYCDSTGLSHWIYGTFNSNDIPCLAPESLRVTNITNKKATLAWTPAENNISYHLHVFNPAFDYVDTCYLARSVVNGLEAGVTYYAAVRAECNGFDEPGDYSDTIQFTTPICPDASNLVALEVYGNSAVLDWTPGGTETSWEILYGHRGFRQEEGISVMTDQHPFTLIDLFGSTEYQAYVRTYCAANFPGEHWIGPVNFTTLYSSIDNISDDSRVHLQPNPTRGDVTLTMSEDYADVLVEVLDVTGRACMNLRFSENGNSHLIPTSKLPAGTYFLRITTNDINTVKKLIVH